MYENNLRQRLITRKPLIGNEQTAGIASNLRDAGVAFFSGRPQANDDLDKKLQYSLLEKQLTRDPELEELKKLNYQSQIDARNKPDVLSFNPPVIAGENGQKEYATGEAFLNSLPPQDKNLIKGLTDYSLSPEKTFGLRNDLRAKYLSLAKQYDPTFDASQFNTRQKYKQELASTKGSGVGRSVVSLNTAIPHMQSLADSIKRLDNSPIPVWNKISNTVKKAFGNGAPADVATALNAVSGELSTVFKGTSGTDQEIESWKSTFDPNASPDQMQSFINRGLELLDGRLSALEGQYENTMGKAAPEGTFIYPKTKSVFDSLRGGPSFASGGNTTTNGQSSTRSGNKFRKVS